MFDAKARTPAPVAPPCRVVIGSRYAPGTVVRNGSTGVYFEVMPKDLGPHAERLQRAFLPKPRLIVHVPRTWAERMVDALDRVLFDWFGRGR